MTSKNLTLKNAHLYFEILEGVPEQPTYDPSSCEECFTRLTHGTYFLYCSTCGTIDFDKPVKFALEYATDFISKQIFYKRRVYCIEKLNLIAGFKTSRSSKFKQNVNSIKEYDFKNIKELKNIMKLLKLHKLYKFIYEIWYIIKGSRLINLTHDQIDILANQFVDIENKFKNSDNKRKNMLNYNSVIYILFRKNKIKGYKHILLPFNHVVIVKALRSFI